MIVVDPCEIVGRKLPGYGSATHALGEVNAG